MRPVRIISGPTRPFEHLWGEAEAIAAQNLATVYELIWDEKAATDWSAWPASLKNK